MPVEKPKSAGSPGIVERLANAFDRVFPRNPQVNPFHRLGEEIFKVRPDLAPSPSQLEQIRLLHTEFNSAFKILNDHDEMAAKAKFQSFHKTHAAVTRAGTLGDVKMDGLETILSEFSAKRTLARKQMDLACEESAVIAKQIFGHTTIAAEEFAAKREREEIAACVSFGLEFSPSPILMAAREFVTTLKNRIRLDAFSGAPKAAFFFLDLN